MPEIYKSRVIEVCSELLQTHLMLMPRGKDMGLVDQSGNYIAAFPSHHGGNRGHTMPQGTAYSVVRQVTKGDPDLYRIGKQLLRK
jgi:hypothetical protein